MPLTLLDGPVFSGRSKSLRDFAWGKEAALSGRSGGEYIDPSLEANHSGLASSVGGELYCHGLIDSNGVQSRVLPESRDLEQLLNGLPFDRTLESLSGGERVRLLLTCAVGNPSERLALDSTLEQLDSSGREFVMQSILQPLSKDREIRIADNANSDIRPFLTSIKRFTQRQDAPPLVDLLGTFCNEIGQRTQVAPAIELDNVTFRYPRARTPIFENANFCFKGGCAYHLRAPNGSGKSTIARLLLGLYPLNRGSICVDGHLFAASTDRRNLLFYCFQNPASQMFGSTLQRYLDAIDQVARRRHGWDCPSSARTVARVIEGFGLANFAGSAPHELPFLLSKWMTIAAALLSRSPWLFFDEPTLGSDEASCQALVGLFDRLAAAGYGVIIISHGRRQFAHLDRYVPITIESRQIMMDTA